MSHYMPQDDHGIHDEALRPLDPAEEQAATDQHGGSAHPEPTQGAGEDERPTPRKRTRKPSGARAASAKSTRGMGDMSDARDVANIRATAPDGRMPHDADQDDESDDERDDERALDDLRGQGFTQDEAIRLIHVSAARANSREVADATATMRRLRFVRWMVEQGMLDEFSA